VADGDDHEQRRFELLYRQHFRTVLRYALARAEPERAKDAVADTFLIAWRRLDDVPSDPAAWLLGVARKVLADQFRADTRRDALAARLAAAWAQAAGPADQVAWREAALAALARLGEPDREVLKLIAWDGLSAAQSAEVLGVSKLTFTVRLHRARRRLAAELGAEPQAGPGDRDRSRPPATPAVPPTLPRPPERHADVRSH
jgi:RNA polymerase sigma-70 factor (ECF subfamily)